MTTKGERREKKRLKRKNKMRVSGKDSVFLLQYLQDKRSAEARENVGKKRKKK